MKTLSTVLTQEVNLTITRPGYFIKFEFDKGTPEELILTLSTIGDISWNGQSWLNTNITVSGVSQTGKGTGSASIRIGNIDNAFGTIFLSRGVTDTPVTIWAIHPDSNNVVNLADPIEVFSGVTNGAEISQTEVLLTLVSANNRTLYSPRVFINKPVFNHLQPVGTKVTFGNETFVLER